MMNKKYWYRLGAPLLLIVAILLVWLATFTFQNLRGIRPAIFSPREDIADLLSSSEQTVNKTNFPLQLPNKTSLEIFARDLSAPRVLVADPNGTIITSIPSRGEVVALLDDDADGVAESSRALLSGLDRPHGLLLDCKEMTCSLYVAEIKSLWRYDYDPKTRQVGERTLITKLPSGGRHTTRTLLKDDAELLISIGSSCDTCVEVDERHGTIQALDLTTGILQTFSSGLRNAVFLTKKPGTDEIWTTEMGRDLLGDDLPPDQINILKKDAFYGWPYCFGQNIQDKNFDSSASAANRCTEATSSHIDLPAHSAPLGLAFVPENSRWPKEYWGNLLVAFHGSWNRSQPTGYKIVRFVLDNKGKEISHEDFISGWLQDDGTSLGRPVDLLARPDGTLYISDDKAGVVYRLTTAQ